MTALLLVLRSVIVSAAVRAGLAPAPGSGDQWGVAYGRGHEGAWEPSDAYEWAEEIMGYSSEFADLLMPDDPHSASDEADRISAVKTVQRYPEADYKPGWAWDDEAWAAFTWRMQTSPVINARRK